MKNLINSIIVDDEYPARENLNKLIEVYCPGIRVAGKASNAKDAKTLIENLQPDVVFLDINMPGINGFDLLESLEEKTFCLIFVTAHNEYGIQAVKANAIDYLLKPISIQELKQTVGKIEEFLKSKQKNEIKKTNKKAAKIVITHLQGFSIYNCDEITRLEASDNYTKIYFKGIKPVLSSKTLKDFEEILDKDKFFRIHKSHIINFDYIKEYTNIDGGKVILYDDTKLSVSRRKVQEFLRKIQNQTLYLK
ncbi:MAG: LytTR family DNA-binding domain-containing protein [Ignavibacteriaceae bacterium]